MPEVGVVVELIEEERKKNRDEGTTLAKRSSTKEHSIGGTFPLAKTVVSHTLQDMAHHSLITISIDP